MQKLLLTTVFVIGLGMVPFIYSEAGVQVKYVNLAGQDVKFNAQFESGPCKNEDIYVGKNNYAGVYRNNEGCDIVVIKGFVKNGPGQWVEVAQSGSPLYRSNNVHVIGLKNKGQGMFEILELPSEYGQYDPYDRGGNQ